MRRLRLGAPLALLALLLAGRPAATQEVPGLQIPEDTTVVQAMELVDGSVVYGRVIAVGPPVRFRLTGGQILTLDPQEIRRIRVSEGVVVDGQVWDPDPNPTRLFFAPTARSTPAGSGYISVYELVIPFLSISLTDRFSIAGGTPLIGGFEGERPFWLAPKLQVLNRERTQVAVGIWTISTGEIDDDLFSLLFAAGTFGSPDRALTLGIGYGMEGRDLASSPLLMAGVENRVSRRVKLVSENWIFPDGFGFLSLGPRFMGDRLSADLGVALAFGDDDTFFFPLVNFVYSW